MSGTNWQQIIGMTQLSAPDTSVQLQPTGSLSSIYAVLP
ncbi:hypothetical protein HNQ08_002526 [Deinococcus humi]|uniref:Uncharacterized protein n=1 Tax=Deinococcus humi TaxID=662880 RepID=A0A7W8JV75_9DEIO|nr:hypothetical protein [Deinococcus humi]